MKLGIVCPIGNLKEHGYHHISDTVLQSFCDFADKVLLISTTETPGTINNKNPKIQLISTNETWFKDNRYSMEGLVNNCNIGMKILIDDGFDVVMFLSINQYIPSTNFENIKNYIQDFLEQDKPHTYLYKMYQYISDLYDADTRLPWILNLHHNTSVFAADSLIISKKLWFLTYKRTEKIRNADYKKYNNIAIVDVVGELTKEEAARLWTFVGDGQGYYHKKLYADNNGNYEHSQMLKQFKTKLQRRNISSKPLDIYGKIISDGSSLNYISHELFTGTRIKP
ncbi:MAG: hypothetical protein PHW62_00225 [Candidatus Ratteibacteria bacterium]|nr:hypothetical protein [Candidatus Ratteibacteria bacterium]